MKKLLIFAANTVAGAYIFDALVKRSNGKLKHIEGNDLPSMVGKVCLYSIIPTVYVGTTIATVIDKAVNYLVPGGSKHA